MSARLPTRSVPKPWGWDSLPAPFTALGENRIGDNRIGEVWFEPPPALDSLLVKYIFTSQALSVQVHPSDAQLPGHGKEECWLVIAAEPGAKLGIGFLHEITTEAMRAAALDGSIESLLEWHEVQAGDFFYIPAGTVHAIGAGISLIEVQQNSDVTYRLYDYGRARELHLDAGVAAACRAPYAPTWRKQVPERGEVTLVDGPLFRLDRLHGPASGAVANRYGKMPLLVVPRSAGVGIGGETIAPGECGLAAGIGDLAMAENALCLITQACSFTD